MGLLSQIIEQAKPVDGIGFALVAQKPEGGDSVSTVAVVVGEAVDDAAIGGEIETRSDSSVIPCAPCITCGCPVAWESVYGDGQLRCEICEPAPSAASSALVGRRVTVVQVNGQAVWAPLDFVLARAKERRERLARLATEAGRNASAESAAVKSEEESLATWSHPDLDGWCYAIDGDGRGRARQEKHLRDTTLQRLDESEARWEERLAAMHKSAELAEMLAKTAASV